MKSWIKLLKAYDAQPVGEILEVDEPIAKALITAGVAEAAEAAEKALAATAAATFGEFNAALKAFTDNAVKSFTDAAAALKRPTIEPGADEVDKKLPTGGFKSLAHFGHTVVRAHKSTPDVDCNRALVEWHVLVAKATPSGMSEGSDPDGGDLIPPQFSQNIWERTRNLENLANRMELMPIAGNTLRVNGDAETSRKDGSRRGGVLGYWEGEAAQYQKSKPQFRHIDLRLKKLTALVYVTNELLEDTGGSLESYINRVTPEELTFKVNDALVNGTGAGTLLGIQALGNGGPLVVVAKESGQAAGTLVSQNIIKMWARAYAPCRKNMAWFINQDVEPQLAQLTIATGTASGQLVYMPPTGLSESPYATLQGRPVIPIEQCQTLGTQGDIILADWSQYAAIKKAVGVQQAMSMHLRFDYDETVFKFTTRMDAQPYWQSPLTPFNGTNTQSPFVVLQTR